MSVLVMLQRQSSTFKPWFNGFVFWRRRPSFNRETIKCFFILTFVFFKTFQIIIIICFGATVSVSQLFFFLSRIWKKVLISILGLSFEWFMTCSSNLDRCRSLQYCHIQELCCDSVVAEWMSRTIIYTHTCAITTVWFYLLRCHSFSIFSITNFVCPSFNFGYSSLCIILSHSRQ